MRMKIDTAQKTFMLYTKMVALLRDVRGSAGVGGRLGGSQEGFLENQGEPPVPALTSLPVGPAKKWVSGPKRLRAADFRQAPVPRPYLRADRATTPCGNQPGLKERDARLSWQQRSGR